MSVDDIIKKLTTCIYGDCHACEYSDMNDNECVDKVLEGAINALNEVKDIVHCKECIHWGYGGHAETDHVKTCLYANWMVHENGFCVYGKRVKNDY